MTVAPFSVGMQESSEPAWDATGFLASKGEHRVAETKSLARLTAPTRSRLEGSPYSLSLCNEDKISVLSILCAFVVVLTLACAGNGYMTLARMLGRGQRVCLEDSIALTDVFDLHAGYNNAEPSIIRINCS